MIKTPSVKSQILIGKNCNSCVHYSKGKCTLLNVVKSTSYDVIVDYEHFDAIECRINPVLCGPDAKYFELKLKKPT